MSLFDFILVLIIAGFGLFGLWFGFIHTLGSLVGTIIGAIIASGYFEQAAQWLIGITAWEPNICRVTMFIIIFFTVNRLIGVLFWLVERGTNIFTKIPGLASLNRFFGILLGLFEGILTVGLALFFIQRFPFSDTILERIAESKVAPITDGATSLLIPFLPETLKAIQDVSETIF